MVKHDIHFYKTICSEIIGLNSLRFGNFVYSFQIKNKGLSVISYTAKTQVQNVNAHAFSPM